METMKYCKDTGRFYTLKEWHSNEISKSYGKFRKAVLSCMSYKLRHINAAVDYTKSLFKRPGAEFSDKLEHWRRHRNLIVVTDDTTDAFKSHADGKYYTSKKKYRHELHARGYEEIGNDKQSHLKVDVDRADKKYNDDLNNDIKRVLND